MYFREIAITGYKLSVSEHGQVYAVGDNKMGQLGLGHQGAPVPSPTRVSSFCVT